MAADRQGTRARGRPVTLPTRAAVMVGAVELHA